MGKLFSGLKEDPLNGIKTSFVWFALEGLEPQLKDKGGEDVRSRPWDE